MSIRGYQDSEFFPDQLQTFIGRCNGPQRFQMWKNFSKISIPNLDCWYSLMPIAHLIKGLFCLQTWYYLESWQLLFFFYHYNMKLYDFLLGKSFLHGLWRIPILYKIKALKESWKNILHLFYSRLIIMEKKLIFSQIYYSRTLGIGHF